MQRLVLLSFCALALATRAADSRPNILLCLADDASWYHFGANGDKICRTPTFDRVALEGVNFTRAFCSSPSCTPSRGALLTGQDFWRLEDGANLWSRWPNRFAVYPDLLAKAGYHVGLKGFEIERFDRDISAMLKLLEDAGQLGNTLVVVTSWPARAKGGRAVDDFVSLTDLAPTFLEAAGLKPLPEMTGHSLLSLLTSEKSGQVEPPRNKVFFGRERHANVRAGNLGYPIRAIRTADFLYLRNFEPDRWPAGDPPLYGDVDEHLSIAGSPSKQAVVEHEDKPVAKRLFELACGKRPAEELYDLSKDPWQMTNVASDPRYSGSKSKLRAELDRYLTGTKDPRAAGRGAEFDRYYYLSSGAPTKPAETAPKTHPRP